jgi:uncharacterized protein
MYRSLLLWILLVLCLSACGRDSQPTGQENAASSVCGAPADLISSVQGAGPQSPMIGQLATIEAVVIADAIDGLGGVFVQESQADRDGDPMTSEGLFIQVDAARPKVARGDIVRVHGHVAELGEGEATLTALVELSSFQFCGKVDEMPQASLIEEPPLVIEDWEALEGMGVIIEPTATILGNYALLSRGELLIGLQGRQWVPTERFPPGAQARGLAESNARAQLLLDDASIANNAPEKVPYLPTAPSIDASYRVGSQVRNLSGVLDQRMGAYRLHPSERIEVVHAPRPESAPELPAGLRVASFNVLNYFNGDGKGGGFPTERGASDADELTRQRAKILSALKAMDADIYVLLEVENDGYEKRSAIEELSSRLNQARGRPREYDYVRGPETRLGDDQISVGLIYRTRKLRLVGPAATLSEAPFNALHRVPLAQTFDVIKTQARFTVVANHWKSKGGCRESDPGNQDRGDGQGCWNAARVSAARKLLEWIATDPTASGDPDVLIIGDLNTYSQEDPLRLLREAGYTQLGSADKDHYSFVYDGLSGSLDHGLASPSLASQVSGATVWHINADEMPDFDYNREGRSRAVDARMFRSDPFRSSDHDPLMLSFDLEPPAPTPVAEPAPEPAAAPPAAG